jgi:PAS domain S-box-containing protein
MSSERQATILNVDDYGPARYSRSRILRSAGFEVLEASTGKEALELLRAHHPQLVILDVNLPDVSGFEVCRQIKESPDTAHVLVMHMSASSVGVENKVAGLTSGCDGYLTEPVDPQELVAHVHALLRLKRAEEALRELNATLTAIIDASPLAVVATDLEGRVTRWSPAATRVFGWTETEVLGKPNPLVPPHLAEEYGQRFGRAVTGDASIGIETERVRKNGTTIPVSVSVGPLRGADGDVIGVLAMIEDISDRKRAQRQMAQLYEEAQIAGRANDDFLATLSHELRTPLNAMSIWVHLLRRKELSSERVEYALDIIERNTQAQVRLIEDILDVSRIVSGKLLLQEASLDLRRVVRTSADTMRPLAANKRQALQVSLPDEPVVVLGDAARLQQVVTNLLSNGVKFTPANGQVSVTLHVEGGNAVIAVRDTGAGIAPEFLPHVFERFSQADSTTSRAHGGLGLGLAIVNHLVGLHGGSVRAMSEGRGRGSTFRVTLPLVSQAAEVVPRPSDERRTDLQGIDVLVVDDEADTRDSLQMLLEAHGARVRVAPAVQEAIDAYGAAPPDVLISDLGMPGEDGYTLVERLRSLDAGWPVFAIALSGYVGDEVRVRAYQAGFQYYLSKPVNVSQLMAALTNAPRRS